MQSDFAPAEGARSSVGSDLAHLISPVHTNSPIGTEKGHPLVRAACLDVVLARLRLTPGDDDDVLVVKCRHDVLPLVHLAQAREVHLLRALEHVRLDLVEERGHGSLDVCKRERDLHAGVAARAQRLLLRNVCGPDFEAKGDTLTRM